MSATFVMHSKNSKVGDVAATYASIQASCPRTCEWHPSRKGGCYATDGNVAFTVRRLDAQAEDCSALDVAKFEASLIRANADKAPNGHALRLHVAGDARTAAAARELARAVEYWPGPCWTYTHAWRTVERASWGPGISVLASVETFDQAMAARARGYVPARVVAHHPPDGKAFTHENGFRWIPCPEQTRGVRCVDCRLCFDDAKLAKMGAGIQFAAHGMKQRDMKRRLEVLR